MIMLIRQMQAMLQSVIVFQKPDPHYRRKIAVVALITTVLEVPIVVSWFMYSAKAVLFVNYYLPCLFGLLVVGLSYFTLQVVLQMRKLPRIINNSKELQDERRNLFLVLVIFDLAFLLRVVLEVTVWNKAYAGEYGPFKYYLVTISPGTLVDVVPLVGVMWLHHQSFKKGVATAAPEQESLNN